MSNTLAEIEIEKLNRKYKDYFHTSLDTNEVGTFFTPPHQPIIWYSPISHIDPVGSVKVNDKKTEVTYQLGSDKFNSIKDHYFYLNQIRFCTGEYKIKQDVIDSYRMCYIPNIHKIFIKNACLRDDKKGTIDQLSSISNYQTDRFFNENNEDYNKSIKFSTHLKPLNKNILISWNISDSPNAAFPLWMLKEGSYLYSDYTFISDIRKLIILQMRNPDTGNWHTMDDDYIMTHFDLITEPHNNIINTPESYSYNFNLQPSQLDEFLEDEQFIYKTKHFDFLLDEKSNIKYIRPINYINRNVIDNTKSKIKLKSSSNIEITDRKYMHTFFISAICEDAKKYHFYHNFSDCLFPYKNIHTNVSKHEHYKTLRSPIKNLGLNEGDKLVKIPVMSFDHFSSPIMCNGFRYNNNHDKLVGVLPLSAFSQYNITDTGVCFSKEFPASITYTLHDTLHKKNKIFYVGSMDDDKNPIFKEIKNISHTFTLIVSGVYSKIITLNSENKKTFTITVHDLHN